MLPENIITLLQRLNAIIHGITEILQDPHLHSMPDGIHVIKLINQHYHDNYFFAHKHSVILLSSYDSLPNNYLRQYNQKDIMMIELWKDLYKELHTLNRNYLIAEIDPNKKLCNPPLAATVNHHPYNDRLIYNIYLAMDKLDIPHFDTRPNLTSI